jgi:hypothetical protein
VIVLGTALSTWGAKAIFDAAHSSVSAARIAFSRVAVIFLTVWLSVAYLGAIAAYIAPLIINSARPGAAPPMLLAANIAAILILGARLYLFDPFLVAVGRVKEVAISAAGLAAVTGLLLVFSRFTPEISSYALPIGVFFTMVFYWTRNSAALSGSSIDQTYPHFAHKALAIAVGIFALCTMPFWPAILLATVTSMIVDAVSIWNLRGALLPKHFKAAALRLS